MSKIEDDYEFKTKQGDYCKVLKIVTSKEIYVMVSCTDDFEISCCMRINMDNIKRRSLKNPLQKTVLDKGYFGVGKYPRTIDGKQSPTYKRWLGLFTRCYGLEDNHNTTYKDCEVCNEWWNFQFYAQWEEENYYEVPGQTMHIEKDFIVKGNKIYSPQYCVFCPININSIITDNGARRGKYTIGVGYKEDSGHYYARVQDGHGNSHWLGTFLTEQEAFKTYKYYKEFYIKQLADEYKHIIPKVLYDAMMNYIVEEND